MLLCSIQDMIREGKKNRLKRCDRYRECPACGMVVRDEGRKLLNLDKPAPCCGASGEPRLLWPTLEVLKFLEIAADQDLDSKEERRIAVVFLCTALELLMENCLWNLLSTHARSRDLVDAVLENTWGRDRRIRLYNRFSDCPLGNLLESREMAAFLKDWDRLSKLRNDIIHGRYFSELENEIDLVRAVYRDCLGAFLEVHNDVQRVVTSAAKTRPLAKRDL